MKKTAYIALLMAFMVLSAGCSSKKSSEEVAAPVVPTGTGPVTPGGGGTGNGSCDNSTSTGNTVCFTWTSYAEFGRYVATHPINDPQNLKLNVQLSDVGSNRYGGTVRISYTDNGQSFEGVFRSDSGVNSNISGSNGFNGVMKSAYNHWFNYQGKTVFSGFFQDEYGAIVLVVDNYLNTGDASGGGFLSGSVWYMNFAQGLAPYNSTGRHCWFLTNGPYECRSEVVVNKTSLYPTDVMYYGSDGTPAVYTKLGTFSGLSRTAAFGN